MLIVKQASINFVKVLNSKYVENKISTFEDLDTFSSYLNHNRFNS